MAEQAHEQHEQQPRVEHVEQRQQLQPQTEQAGSFDEQLSSPLKLTVFHLPKFMKQAKFEAFVTEQLQKGGFTPEMMNNVKVKKFPKVNHGQCEFGCTEDREVAFGILNSGLKLDGHSITAERSRRSAGTKRSATSRAAFAGGALPPNAKRQKSENGDDGSEDSSEPPSLLSTVAPWRNIPYEDQMTPKFKIGIKALQQVTQKVKRESQHNMPSWAAPLKNRSVCCKLEGDVVRSPRTEGYRNKVQFTVGKGEQEALQIGFVVGHTGNRNRWIVAPTAELGIVSDHALAIRQLLYDFCVSRPEYLPYDSYDHTGFWRQVEVRTYDTGQSMVVVQVNPAGITREQLDSVIRDLVAFVQAKASSDSTITSLFWQEFEGISNMAPPDCPVRNIFGESSVSEKLFGLNFRISPKAFFQVNTPGADRLYSIVADMCVELKPQVVLDICCGTGTIALAVAQKISEAASSSSTASTDSPTIASSKCERVIGVEMSVEAILDAKHNATTNGFPQEEADPRDEFTPVVEFHAGKAEDVLPGLLSSHGLYATDRRVVAICDPPRAGMHAIVLKALRACEAISHVIFVSCDPSGLVSNSPLLCKGKSKTAVQAPFVPMTARVVDLFPHTPGVEIVVLFEREQAS